MTSIALPERLVELLKSNEPLDGEEVLLTHDAISSRQLSILDLKQQLADIDAQLAEIKKRKGMLAKEISRQNRDVQACKKLLSHSRLLPPELLRPIFMYAVPQPCLWDTSFATPHLNDTPFSLIRVCRHWRHVALGIPELWTSLSVRTFKGSRLQVNHDPFKAMMVNYFARAGRLPKSLEFHYGLPVDSFTKDHLDGLVNSVFDAGPVQKLTLASLHLPDFLHALDERNIDDRISKQLKDLESLVLRETSKHATSPPSEAITHSPKRILADLPQLRHVAIEQTRDPMWAPQLLAEGFLPWRQLTHLVITRWIGHSLWLRTFDLCNALCQAVFYVCDDDDLGISTVTHTSTSTRHPDLTDLSIICNNGEVPFTLEFQPYHFPSLRNLRLGSYQHQPGSFAFLWDNIAAEIQNLTSLSLYPLTWEVGADGVVDLLLATPNLLSLTLGVSTDYNRIFERLQIDWNGQTLLPKLTELSIDCVDSYSENNKRSAPVLLSFTVDGFTDMVKDRWRPLDEIARLERISLYLPETYGPMLTRMRKSLKREVEEGLILTMETTKRPQWRDPFLSSLTYWNENQPGFIEDSI